MEMVLALQAVLPAVYIIDKDKYSAHHAGWEQSGNEQISYRLITGDAVEYQRIAGRHNDSQTASTACQSCCIILAVPFLHHHRYHDGADGRHCGRCGTGHCAKEHACYDRNHSKGTCNTAYD